MWPVGLGSRAGLIYRRILLTVLLSIDLSLSPLLFLLYFCRQSQTQDQGAGGSFVSGRTLLPLQFLVAP